MQIRILPGPIEGVTNTVAELPRRVIRAGAGVIPGWKWLPPGRCAPPQQGHGFSLRVDFDECGGRTAGGQRDCRSRGVDGTIKAMEGVLRRFRCPGCPGARLSMY